MPPIKLQKIDEALLAKHVHLDKDDHCYFFGEYAAGQGFQHSPMNDLINNLKKPVERKEKPEWLHKEKAIENVAKMILGIKEWEKLKTFTWIPFPPSKTKSDKDYDDRLIRILKKMQEQENNLDVRELLILKKSRDSSHNSSIKKLTPEAHLKNLSLNDEAATSSLSKIVIFDDVITSGSSFKAAKNILSEKFSKIPIIGIFIARSIKTSADP